MSGLAEFEARLAKLQAIEDDKTALVQVRRSVATFLLIGSHRVLQDLIQQVKTLESRLTITEKRLKQKRDLADMYDQRHIEKDGELGAVKQSLVGISLGFKGIG